MTSGFRRRGAAALVGLALCLAGPVLADGITDGNEGREALIKGDADKAIALFTHAITFGGLSRNNMAVTLNLRGRAYLSKGQIEIALDDLNESLKLQDTAGARFNRATVYLDQYRFDDAVDDLTKAIGLGGQGADVYAERGHAYVYTGRLDLAFKDLNEAIKREPGYAFAYRTRGHAYLNDDQDDKAIADETKAISLDPKDMEAYWLRAYAYRYRKKQLDKAIADYTKALEIDPSDSTNRTSRAEAYEQMGRYDLAAADYDDWIKRNPKGAFGYWALGRLYMVQGRNDIAASNLATAVSLKPGDAYNVLWLHLARRRARVDNAAELQANAAKLDKSIWPAPLVSYVTGKMGAGELLAMAAKGDGAAKTTQACEALLFLGQEQMAKGMRDEGLNQLQSAGRTCAADSQEAHLVRADLQRAGAPVPRAIPVSTAPVSATPRTVTAPSSAIAPTPAPASPPIPRVKPPPPKQTAAAVGDPLGLRGSMK